MNIHKLILSSAAVILPFGIANAQMPAATAPVTTGTTATGATDAGAANTPANGAAPAADTAAPADATAQAPAASSQQVAAVAPVTKADVKKGASVHDQNGGMVGKIESVSADAAVVATGKSRVQIPVSSFGKTDQGLVIAMSKTQLEAAASGKSPS